MILFFDSTNERESYRISHIEYDLAFRGVLYAFQRDTRMLWKPTATGEGPHKWTSVAGPFSARAFGAARSNTLREDAEHVLSAATVAATDHHIVIGELILDAAYTIDGQVEFRQNDASFSIASRQTEHRRGEYVLDGQMMLDGELSFQPAHEDSNLNFIRPVVSAGMHITVPAAYQLHYPTAVQVDGEIVVNGEIV